MTDHTALYRQIVEAWLKFTYDLPANEAVFCLFYACHKRAKTDRNLYFVAEDGRITLNYFKRLTNHRAEDVLLLDVVGTDSTGLLGRFNALLMPEVDRLPAMADTARRNVSIKKYHAQHRWILVADEFLATL